MTDKSDLIQLDMCPTVFQDGGSCLLVGLSSRMCGLTLLGAVHASTHAEAQGACPALHVLHMPNKKRTHTTNSHTHTQTHTHTHTCTNTQGAPTRTQRPWTPAGVHPSKACRPLRLLPLHQLAQHRKWGVHLQKLQPRQGRHVRVPCLEVEMRRIWRWVMHTHTHAHTHTHTRSCTCMHTHTHTHTRTHTCTHIHLDTHTHTHTHIHLGTHT